ncbi:MAG TPA: ABC transporter ATP-binding protein, partial [Planctomycetota bacterium]|nr:ABC transporter ATP-binding protein [Planctomycetota bacterium]
MLKIENLTFSYKEHQTILNNINLHLHSREIHVLLGKNGSGKSTLLQIIAGMLQPQQGKIFLEDKDIAFLSPRQIAQKIALVHQNMNYPFNYTVENMVLMGRTPHCNIFGAPTKKDYALAYQALEQIQMQSYAKQNYQELSSGEKQLVLLARALCQSPKILLLDEPNSHLDLPNQWKLLNLIIELTHEYHWTVIAVLHTPEVAYWFAHKVHTLFQGEILYS